LRLAAAEGRYEEEGLRVRKDGSRFWASTTLTALYDEAGKLRGFSKVTRDVTERRRGEEALRESEARYRSVIEQAAENIFLVDVKTKRVLEANAALQSSLGYTAEELRRLTLYDIVDHDERASTATRSVPLQKDTAFSASAGIGAGTARS
jgi:PAS domain-containing protein